MVLTIGNYSFFSCSLLETVIRVENISMINDYAFQYCYNLICIYFYGRISPTSVVMTFESYQNETFGEFNISK